MRRIQIPKLTSPLLVVLATVTMANGSTMGAFARPLAQASATSLWAPNVEMHGTQSPGGDGVMYFNYRLRVVTTSARTWVGEVQINFKGNGNQNPKRSYTLLGRYFVLLTVDGTERGVSTDLVNPNLPAANEGGKTIRTAAWEVRSSGNVCAVLVAKVGDQRNGTTSNSVVNGPAIGPFPHYKACFNVR